MSASASTEANGKQGDEFEVDLEVRQQAQETPEELESRKRTLTLKGFEYQLPFRKKNYQDALVKLRNCVDRVDMLWTDENDTSTLRQVRIELEDNRQALERARMEFSQFILDEESNLLFSESLDIMKQAMDLRKNLGERIFKLEKDEISSHSSVKTSSSKKSKASDASEFRARAVAEVARKKVEWQYAKIETQKMLELKMKECEIEEMKKKKNYERAEAEAAALAKVEEEGEEKKIMTDGLDNVPAAINSEDKVHQYLSTLSANPVSSSAPINNTANLLPAFSAAVITQVPHITTPDQNTDPPIIENGSPATRPSELRPTATSFTPVYTHAPMPLFSTPSYPAVDQSVVSQAIAETFLTARMPPPRLTVFSGDPLAWPTWKSSFETVIERRAINSSEKILYLLQYLFGTPRKVVEGYQFVSTPNAYETAKRVLEKRFGHPSVVAHAFRDKLENWQRISPKDGTALMEFADFLRTCELAMQSVEDLETLNKESDNKKLLRILPSWAHPKWGAKVRDYQAKYGDTKFPPFSTFVDFVVEIAEVQCLPVLAGVEANSQQVQKGSSGYGRRYKRNAFTTGVREPPVTNKGNDCHLCAWCKGVHRLDTCQEFLKTLLKERISFLIKKGLCLRCLEHGHMAKENKCKKRITCARCKQQHPTCLHRERELDQPGKTEEASELASARCTTVCGVEGQESGQDQSLIIPVWVSTLEKPEEEELTYALIDCQSNATFITEKLSQVLGVEGIESHLLLSTMHEEDEIVNCRKIKGLNVTDLRHEVSIPLPQTFTRQKIPFKSSQIPKPEIAMCWNHLKPIAGKLMPYKSDLEVGLLIGTNCPKAIKPREVIPGADNDPYGIRTDLGWGIVGRVCLSPLQDLNENPSVWTKKVVTREVTSSYGAPRCGATLVLQSQAKELFTPTQVKDMFEADFQERDSEKNAHPLSVEDQRFLNILEEGIHKQEGGHYEMPLPLRSRDVVLPNNRPLALSRLFHLKGRFGRDPSYFKDYVKFMEGVIEDCAEVCPQYSGRADERTGKVNYIPHHGVYHPKKPGKICVVFDCSARYAGTCLNQSLLQGPDLTNNLLGVLCRFRQETVAFSCHVQSMFHQFYVNAEDRDLLRFLWWEGGDLESRPIEYRMKVHVFGAASSPGCANFGLKQTAKDGEHDFGADASEFLRQNFYVDDGLKSVKTASAATSLIRNSQAMCAKAGIRLHKFISNTREVLEAIPPEDRAEGLQDLDLKFDKLPIERTLGVMWCIETDCFRFRIVIQDRPLTRRGVLSTVSSVYVPLGFVAPVVLIGKQILQELCRGKVDWDDPIPDNLRPLWKRWRRDLLELEKLRIPRCFKPPDFGEVKSIELHHFSDASESGYGQCSYVRFKNQENKTHVSLVMDKARVSPLKSITIPRLELTAAVVSTRVSRYLKQELDYQDIIEVFWTDSQIVVGYINNEAKRFHTFVANREQEIHNHTKPEQWDYIASESNPADAASRGLSPRQLIQDSCWFKGPEFLWSSDDRLTQEPFRCPPLDVQDPEVKTVSTLVTQSAESFPKHFETCRLDRFSDWFKAKSTVAWCLQLKDCLKRRIKEKPLKGQENKSSENHRPHSWRPMVEDLAHAEREIILSLQHEHFDDEIRVLQSLDVGGEFLNRKAAKERNLNLRKTSGLYRLDPYLDSHGILRIGGRIRRANLPESFKHPIILPRESHITQLIIQDSHRAIKHQGSGMTLNELRQRGYWVIGGTSAVGKFVSRCTICRKLRASPQLQKMADLPKDRTEPVPPFTYSAVDYFGPFLIKEGRKEIKRYGVLFTCMSSRAIHIETSNTLDTNSYISALRRFLAERGPVRQIRSDRGTNFVGARRELAEALDEMDQDKIKGHLLRENCDWIDMKMNVPAASHMGGCWERHIRTVRNVLAALLEESGTNLDDECFRTLMKEVQSIVNSRPLTVNNMASPDFPEPLTPNHLLTMKVKVLMPPPGVFQREDLYSKRRWRRVQHLANVFWDRWRKEYLLSLQQRQKWVKPQRNLMVGDVVLMKDDDLPRNQWKLARVEETLPSEDGFVRKVRLSIGTKTLDRRGRRTQEVQYLERPIHKLVLIQSQDREFPVEEPVELVA